MSAARARRPRDAAEADPAAALAALYARPGFLIRRAGQKADLALSEAGDGVTRTQFGMMYVLTRLDGLDQKRLGELLHIDRSTTGLVVELLERKGYVRRTPSPADRRRKIVALTDAGRHAFPAIERAAAHAQEHVFAALSHGERMELTRLLEKIVVDDA